jgi:hypothetical protein
MASYLGADTEHHLELWEIVLAKDHVRYTANPVSGQRPAAFPMLASREDMRTWLAGHGYRPYGHDPNYWMTGTQPPKPPPQSEADLRNVPPVPGPISLSMR